MDAVTALLKSEHLDKSLSALAASKNVDIEQLKSALKAVAPRLSEVIQSGKADLGSLAMVLLGGAFQQVEPSEMDKKGRDLLDIMFRDKSILEELKQQAASESGLEVSTLEKVLPSIACLVASEASKAMSQEGNEIFSALVGGGVTGETPE